MCELEIRRVLQQRVIRIRKFSDNGSNFHVCRFLR